MALQIPGYRVIRKINQGGMSTVYLAIQISVGRVVALKVMNPQFNSDPAFAERFQREANIVGQLSHPNIVSIYDIGRHEDFNYIAMDYLPNGSVHDRMATGLSIEEVLRITREVASALDHAHEKGYIHRDIKPENILFRADNSAVLSDFGVARGIAITSRMTHVGTVVGTPHYMSPEQTKGKPVDGRSDLYSLGVVLYEMLTGSVPYQGDEAVTIALKHLSAPIPKLPIQYLAYQKLLDKLLAKDANQRFERGRDLIAAIEELEKMGATTVSLTHPADMSVVNLSRALLSAASNALRWRWNKIRRLRWQPSRGFYFAYPTKATDIFFNDMHEADHVATGIRDQAPTQIMRVVQQKRTAFVGLLITAAAVIGAGAFQLRHPSGSPTAGHDDAPAAASLSPAVAQTTFVAPPPASAASSAQEEIASSIAVAPPPVPTSAPSDMQLGALSSAASDDKPPAVANSSSASLADETAQEPPLPTYALEIKPVPEKARVRIMNIPDRYQAGIQLTPGRYLIEVSAAGFDTYKEWIEITDADYSDAVTLKKSIAPGTEITSKLTARIKSEGPEMISIPSGSFFMGQKDDPTAMPVHKVTISNAFAISKFEITFDDYDIFAQATNRKLPDDNRWGRGNRPVINVSFEDAQAYAKWLSQTTGKKYRLPSEAEWEYVARAKTQTTFWWGDNVRDASGRANCRRGCSSKFSGLFGSKTAPVGTYPANGFGVYDTAGNVSEWVQDCFAENYTLHAANGQAYEVARCEARVTRGGSARSSAQQLANHARDYHRPEIYNEHLGFRVVMEF